MREELPPPASGGSGLNSAPELGSEPGVSTPPQDAPPDVSVPQNHADILRRMLAAEEEERGRIARELHDSAGQNLAACRMLIAQCVRGDERARQLAAAQLDALMTEIAKDLHRIVASLRPTSLQDLGLGSALETFLTEWSETTGVAVSTYLPGLKQRLPVEVETILYRIILEALANVARHAKATGVSVIAERQGHTLRVIIEDNGRGFEPPADGDQPGRGLGVFSMQERSALIGGTMEIESNPGGGTSVYLRVPVG